MLRIKGNKLSVAGMQYSLPDEFYIDVAGEGVKAPNGLRFVSPQKDYVIEVQTCSLQYASIEQAIADIFKNDGAFAIIEPVKKYSVNDVTGLSVMYADRKCEYFEIYFERTGECSDFVVLLISADKGGIGIREVIERKAVKEFISGFHRI